MEKNQKAITTIRAGVIKFACKLDNIDNRNRELKNQAWNACDKDNAKLRSAYIFWWEYEFALYEKVVIINHQQLWSAFLPSLS